MASGNELGISFTPTNGLTDYWNDSFEMYRTENDKYLYVADIFPRHRLVVDYSANGIYPITGDHANELWAQALKTYKPSVYILYGSTNNGLGFTSANYSSYLTYLMAQAQKAQDMQMDAYLIGNENLINNSHITLAMSVATLSRSSNIMTATFTTNHGLTTGDYIFVSGASTGNITDSETVETVQCTVIDPLTVTYPSAGNDGTATGTIKMNWSALEVVRKTKAIAAVIQTIFTRGPIVYTESQGHMSPWITLGITPGTDVDLMGLNAYGSGNDEAAYTSWKNEVDASFAEFGTNLIITEHNVVQDSGNATIGGLNHEQAGFEVVADAEIIRRYQYLQSLGITQIYLFDTVEYPTFCNTWPSQIYGNRYKVGHFKPIINKIRGVDPEYVFFGTNKNTGFTRTSGVVHRTGISCPIEKTIYANTRVTEGNCLSFTNGSLGPINFAWGTRYTIFYKAKISSSIGGSARLLVSQSENNYIMLTLNGIKVTNNGSSITGSSISVYNEWHDYAIVYDGAFVRFYRDLAPIEAYTMTINPYSAKQSYTLFNRAAGDRPCNMDCAYFQFYSRAFDPEDIVAHYRSNPNDYNNLEICYRMQEGTGNRIKDSSLNRRNANITNGNWGTFSLPLSEVTYIENRNTFFNRNNTIWNNRNNISWYLKNNS